MNIPAHIVIVNESKTPSEFHIPDILDPGSEEGISISDVCNRDNFDSFIHHLLRATHITKITPENIDGQIFAVRAITSLDNADSIKELIFTHASLTYPSGNLRIHGMVTVTCNYIIIDKEEGTFSPKGFWVSGNMIDRLGNMYVFSFSALDRRFFLALITPIVHERGEI